MAIYLLCKKNNHHDALKIYVILMLCYGSYAFLCHGYRMACGFEAIGSMDGPGYYLPCTTELLDSQSLKELVSRISARKRYHLGGYIFVYFVYVAKLAQIFLNVDLHLAIQLSLMPFAALTCVAEYHLLQCFDISKSQAYKWSIGFGLGSALFWLSSFIVRDLPITLAYAITVYLIFSTMPRWVKLLIGTAMTVVVINIRTSSGIALVPLTLFAIFCNPKDKTIKPWQLAGCISIALALVINYGFADEFDKVYRNYLAIELMDQGGKSTLSGFNVLPFGISHIAKTIYAQFHPIPVWRNMFATASNGFRAYAFNITKFPDIWVVFFRLAAFMVLIYGCFNTSIRQKVFKNRLLLYSFIYVLLVLLSQASTIEERRKLALYPLLFVPIVLSWRHMSDYTRKYVLLLTTCLFIIVQITGWIKDMSVF